LPQTHADLLQGATTPSATVAYVLPVRARRAPQVEGIVLGSSASGGTLFVEPREARRKGTS
jgi:dsDNA-specific endonuclease/ATPase MutS2